LGITFGSATWWLLLSGGVAFILHHRLSPTVMRNINRFSGIIIFAFGIFALSMK
jgi:arginine exporter protein ArgO